MQVITVGVASVDFVDYVEDFPKEDDKITCSGRIKRLGGSACTTACVLRELLSDPDEYVRLSMGEFLDVLAAKRTQGGDASEKSGEAMDADDKVVISVVYPSFRTAPPPPTGGFGIMAATSSSNDHHTFVLHELEDKRVVAVPVMMGSGVDAKKFVFPESHIIVSKNTGSHTVIQARNLPDIKCNDFIDSLTYIAGIAEKEGKTKVFWFHFEGRNVDETKLMIKEVHSIWKGRVDTEYFVSVEIASTSGEKDELKLIPLAHIVIVSKSYLSKMKYSSPDDFLDKISAIPETKPLQGTVFFFPNGSKGSSAIRLAFGIKQDATSPAFESSTKDEMYDTVGARDALIAGVIYAMGHRKLKKLQDILDLVNRIASASISRNTIIKE